MRTLFAIAMAGLLATMASAQTSPEFPRGATYIIQLTSSQHSSGLGEFLLPPVLKAFRKAGLRYEGSARARYAASVESRSDVGAWYDRDPGRVWLYDRRVTVGLSPAEADIEPEGRLEPSFAVTARLLTPDGDRIDEFDCLVALATRELAARYRPTGRVIVDGSGCARR